MPSRTAQRDTLLVAPKNQLLDSAVRYSGLGPSVVEWEPADSYGSLQRALAAINKQRPALVLAVDGAAQALVGEEWPLADGGRSSKPEKIDTCRGFFFDVRGTRVLPLALSPLVGDPKRGSKGVWVPWRKLLDVDLEKAKREIALGCPPLDSTEVEIVTEQAQVAAVLEAARAGELGCDIENDASLTLSCLGIADSAGHAWVVPASERWQLELIEEVVSNEDYSTIWQNGAYDRYFLRKYAGIEVRNQIFDTMLAWAAFQPELAGQKDEGSAKKRSRKTEKGLRFLASVYTRRKLWKNYNFDNEMQRYGLCGEDCGATWEIAQKVREQLR